MAEKRDDLEARRSFRQRLHDIETQYPELKTPAHRQRLALSPEVQMALGMQAAMETYQYDCAGTIPPVHMREYMLVLALQAIATGDVKTRDLRAYAARTLAMWQKHQQEEEEEISCPDNPQAARAADRQEPDTSTAPGA